MSTRRSIEVCGKLLLGLLLKAAATVAWAAFALVGYAASLPLPAELAQGSPAVSESTRFVDAEGRLLHEVRAGDAMRASWVDYAALGESARGAILAAEDRRFFSHHGVDPLSVLRAVVSDVTHMRVVSGASTLTMQLARLLRPHPRNLAGKLFETALALRIEASVDKVTIFEQYANRAPFGDGLRGMDAASRFWFDKPPRDLSLAEAATLAAIPRGPAIYAIDKHPAHVLRRRDRILDRMQAAGWISHEREELAREEPLVARAGKGGTSTPHLVSALVVGDPTLWPVDLGPTPAAIAAESVQTTIDGTLQREVELATKAELQPLAGRHVANAAVVILDNESGDVLAYVGSEDFRDNGHGGQNDGVRARRQPGSTLKPFVYGLAMERLGWTAATVLPDVELQLTTEEGTYAPTNYDGRFHGPVRLREALGNSLNVPAVWTAQTLGADAVLERLRALGFASLTQNSDWYGPGIVLGDGEVTLLQLATAYAAIARDGVYRAPRAVKHVSTQSRQSDVGLAGERRVMPREVALVLSDILSDPRARAASFGAESVLDFPFDVAAKTGTSKGARDNWTVGFTSEVTVAVWVGNFDGTPMQGTSGITGAAPLFHDAMEAAMRGRTAGPLRIANRASRGNLVQAEVCPLSGGRPTRACAHEMREWMLPGERDALRPCDMHESLAIDQLTGLRAGAHCPRDRIVQRIFERYDGPLREWASTAGRPIAPSIDAPFSPKASASTSSERLSIRWPNEGTRFVIDPDRPLSQQELRVRIEATDGVRRVDLVVDGRTVADVGSPFVISWPLSPGEHVLAAVASSGIRSSSVTIRVE